jgi:hypothetical protein
MACLAPHAGSPGAEEEAAALQSPYFGQPTPGFAPELFAPGVVSTTAIELNGVFTPDMKEFFFSRLIDGVQTMYHSILEGVDWTEPQPLLLFPEGARAVADDMAASPDGQELYFLGIHAHAGSGDVPTPDIWVSRRRGGRWSTAEIVGPPISTRASESYPVIVADGSLYFSSSRPGGPGPNSLYRAQRLPNGSFGEPELVGSPVNGEAGVGDVYVSPDERYMVFGSRRLPNFGPGDLFVSFRRGNDTWSEPVNLGNTINTEFADFCPMVTPDGKYLFFSRRQGNSFREATAGDVYWVDARILDQFRP